jgi:SPX domain protein involved in polyphosphate accumulation
MNGDNMKLHKDFYEYKKIPFTYFAKIKNRHDFKREWVTVRCQEDILKQQPQNVEIRRLKKNV